MTLIAMSSNSNGKGNSRGRGRGYIIKEIRKEAKKITDELSVEEEVTEIAEIMVETRVTQENQHM